MQQLIYHLVEKRTHARNEELFELKKGKQIKDQENRLSSRNHELSLSRVNHNRYCGNY